MIYFFSSIAQLKRAVDSLIEFGDNTPISVVDSDGYLDGLSQIEVVFINAETGRIVGEESEDYRPKDGEILALKIS